MNMEVIAAVGWASTFMAAYQWWAWRKLAVVSSQALLSVLQEQEKADNHLFKSIRDMKAALEEDGDDSIH